MFNLEIAQGNVEAAAYMADKLAFFASEDDTVEITISKKGRVFVRRLSGGKVQEIQEVVKGALRNISESKFAISNGKILNTQIGSDVELFLTSEYMFQELLEKACISLQGIPKNIRSIAADIVDGKADLEDVRWSREFYDWFDKVLNGLAEDKYAERLHQWTEINGFREEALENLYDYFCELEEEKAFA